MVRIIGERWSDLVCGWRTVDVFGAVMIAPTDRPRAFGRLGAEGLSLPLSRHSWVRAAAVEIPLSITLPSLLPRKKDCALSGGHVLLKVRS